MRIKLFGVKTLIIVVALVLGTAVGTLGYGLASAKLNPSGAGFPQNENGQTYGSALYATSSESQPDLIKAYGVDGTLGYVRAVDLDGPMPKTPEEALEHERNRPGKIREIPLYDVDGKTVIGVFRIHPGKAHSVTGK